MKYGVIFFLAIFLFASCATSNQASRDAAKKWKSHGIHNYNYQIYLDCFCPEYGDYKVEVRNDTVSKVLKIHYKRLEEISGDALNNFHSFDGYYSWFEKLRAENYEIDIEQDSIYHYPKVFTVHSYNGTGFKIKDVEFLK